MFFFLNLFSYSLYSVIRLFSSLIVSTLCPLLLSIWPHILIKSKSILSFSSHLFVASSIIDLVRDRTIKLSTGWKQVLNEKKLFNQKYSHIYIYIYIYISGDRDNTVFIQGLYKRNRLLKKNIVTYWPLTEPSIRDAPM